MLRTALSRATLVVLLIALAGCSKPSTSTTTSATASTAPLVHAPPLSCGNAALGHCYATSASALPVQFGSTRLSIAALNVGTMDMIDDEAWLIDASSKCHGCWIEAGYDAQSTQYAGGSSYFVGWQNEQGLVSIPLAQVRPADVGKTIVVTLELNAPQPGFDTITVSAASLNGTDVYTVPSAMTAGRFQFGQELAGSGSASAGRAVFDGVMVGGQRPGAPLAARVDASNNPPFAVWLNNTQFETRCCQ